MGRRVGKRGTGVTAPESPSGILSIMDELLSDPTNRTILGNALRELLREKPLAFFNDYVMALAPKLIRSSPAGGVGMLTAAAVAEQLALMMERTSSAPVTADPPPRPRRRRRRA